MNRGGGYPLHLGNGDVSSTQNWWQAKNGLGLWVTSNTWGYARHLYTFLIIDEPGGYLLGWANGTATNSYTGLNRGDVLFYDWTNDGTIDHVTMLTGTGKDPNWHPNQIGDLISQHEPERLNTWWTAYPYNPNRNYTRIRLVGVGAGN